MSSIVGLGVDISSIKRFRHLKHPERVAAFYLSPAEWENLSISADRAQSLASRFAAKEAVIKALPEPVSPLSFEIVKDGLKPAVRWRSAGTPYHVILSISHEDAYACATAICTTAH